MSWIVRMDKVFNVVSIDRDRKKGSLLKGDNIKFLQNLNLNLYDIIDLDAYGVPFQQLKMILPRLEPSHHIFVTFIQTIYGRIPMGMLIELGYTKRMVKKCPILFCLDGLEKFKRWISLYGIDRISAISIGRKHYLFFRKT